MPWLLLDSQAVRPAVGLGLGASLSASQFSRPNEVGTNLQTQTVSSVGRAREKGEKCQASTQTFPSAHTWRDMHQFSHCEGPVLRECLMACPSKQQPLFLGRKPPSAARSFLRGKAERRVARDGFPERAPRLCSVASLVPPAWSPRPSALRARTLLRGLVRSRCHAVQARSPCPPVRDRGSSPVMRSVETLLAPPSRTSHLRRAKEEGRSSADEFSSYELWGGRVALDSLGTLRPETDP